MECTLTTGAEVCLPAERVGSSHPDSRAGQW